MVKFHEVTFQATQGQASDALLHEEELMAPANGKTSPRSASALSGASF